MSKPKKDKLSAMDWLPFFRAAGIRTEELDASKSEFSKAIKLGQFLSPKVGSELPIQVGGRTGKAILRVQQERAKAKLYYLEVRWDSPVPEGDSVGENSPESEAESDANEPSAQQGEPANGAKKSTTSATRRRGKRRESPPEAAPAAAPAGEGRTSSAAAAKTAGNDEEWG